MFFIMGITDGRKDFDFTQTVICDDCGMKVTILTAIGKEELLLGNDVENGQRAMVLIPKGAIFAAENLEAEGFLKREILYTGGYSNIVA